MLRFASEEARTSTIVDVDAGAGEQIDVAAQRLEVQVVPGFAKGLCGAVKNLIDEARKRIPVTLLRAWRRRGRASSWASLGRKSGKPSQSSRLQSRMIEGSLTLTMLSASVVDQMIAVLGVSRSASAARDKRYTSPRLAPLRDQRSRHNHNEADQNCPRDEKKGRCSDCRADVFTDAGKHLPRQRPLVRACDEER